MLDLDIIRVKGRERPVRLFALVGETEQVACPAWDEYRVAHEALLGAMRANDREGATEAIGAVRAALALRSQWCAPTIDLEGIVALYARRIEDMPAGTEPAQRRRVAT